MVPTIPSDLPPEVAAFVAPIAEPLDVPQSEDCLWLYVLAISFQPLLMCCVGLNINVIVPAGTRPGAGLPVAAVSTMWPHPSFREDIDVNIMHSGYSEADSKWGPTPCTSDHDLAKRRSKTVFFILIRSYRRPGAVIVNRSIELGQPVIFVAMNYRYV